MSLRQLLFYLERFAKLLNLRWIISCQVLGVSCIWSKLWCIMNLKMYWIKPFTKQILRLQYQQTLCWQTFSIYCFISCPRRTFFVLFIASHSAWACAFRKEFLFDISDPQLRPAILWSHSSRYSLLKTLDNETHIEITEETWKREINTTQMYI